MNEILYIEDDELEAQLFCMGLKREGYDVLHIPGEEAEALAFLNSPSYHSAKALVFDFWIGVTNGLELAQQLRLAGDQRPFFLLTAADNPNPGLLRQLDITYVQKPANYRSIARSLNAG